MVVFLFFGLLFSQEISEVKIEGNINVRKSEIKKVIKTKKGSDFSKKIISEDIKEIFKLGYFEDVEVHVDTISWVVKFHVKEKPFVKKVEFKGNRVFSDGKLREKIATKSKEFLNYQKLRDDIDKISELYKDKGYADVEVKYFVVNVSEERNLAVVNFTIEEGEKYIVKEIVIEGANFFKPKKIFKILKTKKNKFYSEKMLKEDMSKLEKFYKDRGFLDVNIILSKKLNERYVSVKINIQEGKRYKIGSIVFQGNSIYKEKELKKSIPIKPNRICAEKDLRSSIDKIYKMYMDKGYLKAKVEYEFFSEVNPGSVGIKFKITENEVIYPDQIFIEGCKSTKEYVIRRELLIKKDKPLTAYRVRRSYERLYNLGFLESVKIDFQPTRKINMLDVIVSVSEGRPGMLQLGAGYSDIDKLFGYLQLSHLNLFGRAQKLTLLCEFGDRRRNFQASWSVPYTFGRPITFELSGYDFTRARDYGPYLRAYKVRESGGEIKFGPRIGEYFNVLLSYSAESIEYIEVLEEIKKLIGESPGLVSSVSLDIRYDTRDNIFNPTRGSKNSIYLKYAGLGGKTYFAKYVFTTSWFFPTFWEFVLSLNNRIGYAEGFRGQDLPLHEKFLVGGADTVRGYLYRHIGPPEGGNIMYVFNVEYKFPLVKEKGRPFIVGAFFYDVGGSWTNLGDINFTLGNTKDNLRSGVGFGVRLVSPAFPIRLDFGWALNPSPGTDPFQYYFNIGPMF